MRAKLFFWATAVLLSTGCASKLQVIVDPKSIADETKYQRDMDECHGLAKSYDLSDNTRNNALLGAAGGGIAVAGIATAVAGAVFLPALPFIAAGAAAGGLTGGGLTKSGETTAREKIWADCMKDRSYRIYAPS